MSHLYLISTMDGSYVGATTQPPLKRFSNHCAAARAGSPHRIHRVLRGAGPVLLHAWSASRAVLDQAEQKSVRALREAGVGVLNHQCYIQGWLPRSAAVSRLATDLFEGLNEPEVPLLHPTNLRAQPP